MHVFMPTDADMRASTRGQKPISLVPHPLEWCAVKGGVEADAQPHPESRLGNIQVGQRLLMFL
jgi:hypothetical protein